MDTRKTLSSQKCEEIVAKFAKNREKYAVIGRRIEDRDFFGKTTDERPKRDGYGLGTEDRDAFPKLDLEKEGLMGFEELKTKGYRVVDNRLNLQEMLLAMASLADYHAACVDKTRSKDPPISEFQAETPSEKSLEALCEAISNGKPEKGPGVDELKAKLLSLLEDGKNFEKILTHAALAPSKMMFLYENGRGKATDCKLLESKRKTFKAPLREVLEFVYRATDAEFRRKHLHELLERYRERSLDRLCEGHGAREAFSGRNFKVTIKQFLPKAKISVALEILCEQSEAKMVGQMEELLAEIQEMAACSRLLREDCYEIVGKKTTAKEWRLVSFEMLPLKDVCGFLGDYFGLGVEISVDGRSETLDFFVKCLPSSGSQIDIVRDGNCFGKEQAIYETVVAMMKGVGIDYIHECLVPSYFSRFEDLMVFEDMRRRGFSTISSRTAFDPDLLLLIAKRLAKFHAATVILEERLTKITGRLFRVGDEIEEAVLERIFAVGGDGPNIKVMEVGCRTVLQAIDLFYGETMPQGELEDFKRKARRVSEILYERLRPSRRFRNVINQGDLWSSNILVKIGERGEPIDCRLIDFQHARYCPPSNDLLALLHFTTDRATRAKWTPLILEEYHSEFARTLAEHAIDAEAVFSKETFLEACEYSKAPVAFQSCLWFQFIGCAPEDIQEFTADEESAKRVFLVDRKDFIEGLCAKSDEYKKRLGEALEDLREVCRDSL